MDDIGRVLMTADYSYEVRDRTPIFVLETPLIPRRKPEVSVTGNHDRPPDLLRVGISKKINYIKSFFPTPPTKKNIVNSLSRWDQGVH